MTLFGRDLRRLFAVASETVAIRLAVAANGLLDREGLAHVLDRAPGFEVVAVAPGDAGLARTIASEKPDAVVLDVEGRAKVLPQVDPRTALLVLAAEANADLATALIARGRERRGYLIKDSIRDPRQLLTAVKKVASGGTVIDQRVIEALVAQRRNDAVPRWAKLTPRELEVLGAIAQGHSNAAIARSLQVSTRAIERYVGAIFRKLNLASDDVVDRRVAATLFYLRNGQESGR
jgi:DNA-binding NarL/FixJ family response regulator